MDLRAPLIGAVGVSRAAERERTAAMWEPARTAPEEAQNQPLSSPLLSRKSLPDTIEHFNGIFG